ncbi:MAG: hypothetical protein LBF87_08285 [Treponema sp.]|nr:hypothetical protein [Treponema sp.]
MAKISEAKRELFLKRTASYKMRIVTLLQEEKSLLENKAGDPCSCLALAETMLNISSYYIVFQKLSLAMLNASNDSFITEGRKYVIKAISYLEAVTTNKVDAPFSEYEDKLAAIEAVDPTQRYRIAQKLGFTLELFEQALGENSRWKWSCVELTGKVAAVIKNLIDLKKLAANTDIYSPWYESTTRHMRFAKEMLMKAADRYRVRYEVATNQIDDFRIAINFLNALRRLHLLLGEADESEIVKKKSDNWSAKFEENLKKQ